MLLYLLCETSTQESSLRLQGRFWKLEAHEIKSQRDEKYLGFICMSYTWGLEREPSPFELNFEISKRTIPALNTLIQQRPSCKRFWIDALCVPHTTEERALTLESMGYIYSIAQEVVVVLSTAAQPVISQMSHSDRLEHNHLDILEREDWVSRAWTYQEAVNSYTLSITCEDSFPNCIVSSDHFLNCLGFTLSKLKGSNIDKRRKYPCLDAFEDLFADCMIARYSERSALQVMSNMHRRTQGRAEDHFYAMIGAISDVPASSLGSLDPCEAFMQICERKGDYSFIYSAAERDSSSPRRWRPAAGAIPPIFPGHCYGSAQVGHIRDGYLHLEIVLKLEVAPLENDAKDFIESWLSSTKHYLLQSMPSQLHHAAYTVIHAFGYLGSAQPIDTKLGFFFPFMPIRSDQVDFIFITTTVKWAFGAPGLAAYHDGEENIKYTPGVLTGTLINKLATTTVKLD